MPMQINSRKLTKEVPKGKRSVNVTIAEIQFQDGKVNSFDFDAVANLRAAMDQCAHDDDVICFCFIV